MIIAIATEGAGVAPHFGRCPQYSLFEVSDGAVKNKKMIDNPGHEPGFLPRYLSEMGVSCIIAGGMGHRAQSLFDAENIETCIGVSGPVDDAINAYLAGTLEVGESSCTHHEGGHSCS